MSLEESGPDTSLLEAVKQFIRSKGIEIEEVRDDSTFNSSENEVIENALVDKESVETISRQFLVTKEQSVWPEILEQQIEALHMQFSQLEHEENYRISNLKAAIAKIGETCQIYIYRQVYDDSSKTQRKMFEKESDFL